MSKKFLTEIEAKAGVVSTYLEVDTTANAVVDVAKIVWNPIDGTFDMGLLNGVTLQAGQEQNFYGKASGSISNGDAVMFAGQQGDHFLMAKATQVALNANPEYFIGIATQDFVDNQFGYVTCFGKVRNLDTSAYSLGTLYFNSAGSIAGSLTNTEPEAPFAKIIACSVISIHQTQGVLFVRPDFMPKLEKLQNVYSPIAGRSNNDVLGWDAANSRFTTKSISNWIGYSPVPTTRTLTINGVALDLSADRSWTIGASSGVSSFNTRTGAVTLGSSDVTSALGYTPYNSTNPNGYITGITSTMVTNALGYTPYNSSNPAGYITGISFANVSAKPTTLAGYGITDAASSTHNHNGTYWPVEGGWKPASLASSTRLIGKTSPDGGEFGLAYSGGQIHAYTDGFFYQNEGQYRVIDSSSIGSQSVNYANRSDGALKLWATSHPNDFYIVNNWTGSHWHLTTNHGSPVRVGYADSAGSAGSLSSMNISQFTNNSGYQTNGGQVNNLSTNYAGGVQGNPQVYFNNGIGLKVAMTGSWSTWSDTLWINGYAGGDVPWMCALHFLRNSEPRMAISAQTQGSSGYGSYYEVHTDYHFNKTNPTFNQVYANDWFRANGDVGLYMQSYGAHLRTNIWSSYGTFMIHGYNKNGYGSLNIYDPQGYSNNMMFENGNGGMYQENGGGWGWYYNRGSDCFAAAGSGTSPSYRFISNGSAQIQGDLNPQGYTGFGGNVEWANGTTQYHGSNEAYNWRDWGGWGGYWWNRNGGDMIMNLYALYAVTGGISDIRYKKDVEALPYGLKEIMQLNPIKFHYNLPKESMLANDPDFFLGFSAQEVQGLIPEAVHEKINEDVPSLQGMLAITYDELIPVAVQAIKDQQVIINNQDIRIQKLEALVNQLLNK